ncbi:hypothetical protein BIW11_04786 [Tropilaelaps mercedesae]|uniref:Uncharacterized protein n=1 Tax=Tropilaelaps mercedesae TaxID=418985 RepID=A0A1V9X1E8_9ACAR|nr:hypothetical protein BIW11_04786 [Tropilaelaps mercedesae]
MKYGGSHKIGDCCGCKRESDTRCS